MVGRDGARVLSLFFHLVSSSGQMTASANLTRESAIRRRGANRFDSETPGESDWHKHRGGQFIIVELGISHLRTEFGAWIIPAPRVGWVPPGVRHSSRASGRGRDETVVEAPETEPMMATLTWSPTSVECST